MAKRKRLLKIFLGILIGITLSQLLTMSKLLKDLCGGVGVGGVSDEQQQQTFIKQPQHPSSNKSLLFVGVMTAGKYLNTRAKAVYDTWGRDVPGKIVFFSSEYSYSHQVPLVPLIGVDDSYPPQKKSFMMLKYMHDNYLDQYEWFLRADDDVYIRTDRLEELLRSVDSKRAWFIGQTGRGNSEEFGLLSLDNDENFCMGGPGVILSRETLRRMAPYVEDCLTNLYTTHEDVELGRCVKRFAGISCTWSYEASPNCACKMQVIFYHNNSGRTAFTGDLKQKEVHRAITLHPVKQPQYMYKLHNYVKGLKIQQLLQNSIYLHRDIANSMKQLGYRLERLEDAQLVKNLSLFPDKRGSKHYLGNTQLLGTPAGLNRYKAHKLDDVLEWEFISKNVYSHRDLNPRRRIGTSLKEGLNDVVREIMEVINSYSKQRGRVIDYKEILYGYWRLNPLYGVDLILDLLLVYRKYRGHKMTVQVRRHSYVQQTFSGIYIKEINDETTLKPSSTPLYVHEKIYAQLSQHLEPIFHLTNQSKKSYINFILPLYGRYEIFKRFMKLYEFVCIKNDEPTRLYIILYNNDENIQKTLDFIETYRNNNNDIFIVQVNETFSRGKALQIGVNHIQNNNELMLFIDVDMIFDTKTLQRIRFNTKLNRTIYFPIVYSLYNEKLNNNSFVYQYPQTNQNFINEMNGFWRQFGFGIVSLYKSDYLNLGGFNLTIHGWGNEDVTFFDNAIKSHLKIIRCIDTSLIHIYHNIKCDNDLDIEQKIMCLGTMANTLGSTKRLQQLYIKYKYLFR